MSHQGRLLNSSGNPVADGNYTIKYELFQSETAGTAVYTETKTNVPVKGGLFNSNFGLGSTIDPTLFSQPTWLQITVNGTVLTPRQRLMGSPYAFSLTSGAIVQGLEPYARTYGGQANTGAGLLIANGDNSANGGSGLIATNRAELTSNFANVAALQGRAAGKSYGAIVTSEKYRAMSVKSNDPGYYDAVFEGALGISVSAGCTGCVMAFIGQNVGGAPIQAGDFVTIEGVVEDPDFGTPVMQVRKATGTGDVVIGIMSGAMVRSAEDGFNGAGETAASGSYLTVATAGLVKARAASTDLQPGASLMVGANGAEATGGAGFARAISTVDAEGMVWVMLGGQ